MKTYQSPQIEWVEISFSEDILTASLQSSTSDSGKIWNWLLPD